MLESGAQDGRRKVSLAVRSLVSLCPLCPCLHSKEGRASERCSASPFSRSRVCFGRAARTHSGEEEEKLQNGKKRKPLKPWRRSSSLSPSHRSD
ncbi:hypothetical protein LZ31DRAFT_349825 [Colletotrichum somersetense]|nr:hypothetical protein LZ31DRAFT_349825 [Colletotrichum somersetense]